MNPTTYLNSPVRKWIKRIAHVMFLMRTGACMGLIMDAMMSATTGQWLNVLWMSGLALVICPVWDDYQ